MRMIKSSELQRIWRIEKERLKGKLERLIEKQKPKKESIPATFRDILIGDAELKEKFGDTEPKVAIYGGIEASENVKEFLKLPVNMRVYNNIKKVEAH